MKKFNRSRLLLSMLFSAALVGCDSSDDAQVVEPQPEKPRYDNFHLDVEPNTQFNGAINVYMGQWFPCSTDHPEMCIDAGRAVPIQEYSQQNRNNKLTRDPSLDQFVVTAQELRRYAGESGRVPIRTDLFAEHQFSILDVLLYISDQRDDFDLTLGEYDPAIGTYPFTVSYDFNRDGVVDANDGEQNHNSADWYVAFLYTDGEWKRGPGSSPQEPIYGRLDEFVVRNDMHLRLRPFAAAMTERRQAFQAREVSRLEASGGKTVLPELRLNFEDGRGWVTVARDIEVKPFDLRPDLYRPGALTLADALMSADEQGLLDIEFTFWPTLSTKADVGAFAVSSVNGQRADGMKGWAYTSGELDGESDFFWAPFYPTAQMLVANDQAGEGPYFGKCPWLTEQNGGKHTLATAQVCIDNWYSMFGGNNIHQMTDMAVMRYPKGAINLHWNYDMYQKFEVTQTNSAGDGKNEVYDISRAVAPLTEEHFGWGVANCGVCHSVDNTHLAGDAPHLPDVVQPYYCASCHGSNGAPKGHGETGRCFWCHSENVVMVNHGDASRKQAVADVGCSGTTGFGQSLEGEAAPCADRVGKFLATHDQAENASSYPELLPNQTTVGNSDWNTSETFPDPYACVTCHPAR